MGVLDGLLGGLFAGVGSAASSWMNWQSQKETNATSIDLANTAVQRRAADMEAAGINPIMAAGQPAAVPGLQAPKVGNPVQDAMQGAVAAQNIAQSSAQEAKTAAEARSANADAALKEAWVFGREGMRSGDVSQHMAWEEKSAQFALVKNESMVKAYEANYAPDFARLNMRLKEVGAGETEQRIAATKLAIQLAQKENNWFQVNQLTGVLRSLVGAAATGVGAYFGSKGILAAASKRGAGIDVSELVEGSQDIVAEVSKRRGWKAP